MKEIQRVTDCVLLKKQTFTKNPLNEKLFQSEGEDIDWPLNIRQKTEFKKNCKNYSQRS